MRIRAVLLTVLALAAACPAVAQALRATGPAERLALDAAPAARPAWSPDGALVAYTRPGFEGVWVVAPGGSSQQLSASPGVGFGFSWSPDGSALITRTAREDGLRRVHALEVVGLDGSVRAVTDERSAMAALPRWVGSGHVALASPSGLEVIALEGAQAAPTASVALSSRGRLVVGEPSTGVARVVGLEAPVINVTPSPDGQRIAYEVYGGNLFVSDLEGGNRVDLGPGGAPTWSPDGRWLAYAATEDDGHTITASDLVAVRTDGSDRVTLTSTADRLEADPSWSPDGRSIVFADAADDTLYVLSVAE